MLSKLVFIPIVFLLITLNLFSQDSSKVFSYKDFFSLVKSNHPISKRLNLIKNRAEQGLRGANGNFDPRLVSEANQKVYSEKEYYLLSNTTLVIPTWYGADIMAGFETSQGSFLDDSDKLPINGLGNIGIKIPLGQGLFIDKRRNAVLQAELLNDFADIEIINEQNSFFLEANNAYWDWFSDYNKLIVFQNAERNSKFRFESIKVSYFAGDAPAIDTVEALIQYQNIQAGLQVAEQDYIISKNNLNTYIWDSKLIPLELSKNSLPEVIDSNFRNVEQSKFDSLIAINPKIKYYEYKTRSAELDKELYTELLKPKLNLKANVLTAGFNLDKVTSFDPYYSNNYKLGFDFQFNLFLRQELSNLEIANIKIQEFELDLSLKRVELKNKINSKYNKYLIVLNNLALLRNVLENYRTMLKAEEIRLQIGESSLFIINSREQKLIESEIKYFEQYTKTKQALAELLAELAILHLEN